MNNNNAYQQAIADRYKQIEQLRQLRENQKKLGLMDFAGLGLKTAGLLGQAGLGLSRSQDPRVARFGNKLYKYSGREFYDKFNQNPWDTTKEYYNGLQDKLNYRYMPTSEKIDSILDKEFPSRAANSTANTTSALGNTTNTLNNTTNTLGSTTNTLGSTANTLGSTTNTLNNTGGAMTGVASNLANAGKAASTAGNAASATGSALSSAGKVAPVLGLASAGYNAAKGNYVDAGLDAASTAASFVPVYGWAAAAAIQAGKMIKNMIMGKKQEQAQKALSQAENASGQKAEESKQQAMQNITRNGQNQQPEEVMKPLGEEELKKQMLEKILNPGTVMSDTFGHGPDQMQTLGADGQFRPYEGIQMPQNGGFIPQGSYDTQMAGGDLYDNSQFADYLNNLSIDELYALKARKRGIY